VCRYEVIGLHYENPLPSTTISDDELPQDDEYLDCGYDGADNCTHDADPVSSENPARRAKPPHEFDGLTYVQLLEEKLEDLRGYAANHLKIVGASHIPGGKIALLDAIARFRQVVKG